MGGWVFAGGGEEAKKKKKEGLMVMVTVRGGSCSLNIQQARTNARTHKCRRTTSEIPAPPPPPPTHRRTHGEAGTEALSRPSFCLEKFAYVSMHRQRGEHVLNGDRGEVDYTVSTGDLMTDTHGAPPPSR